MSTMKKRMVSLVLFLAILLSQAKQFVIEAKADTVASGRCGDNITWELDTSGTLTLKGSGAMEDYGEVSEDLDGGPLFSSWARPWDRVLDQIESIVIGEGITYIGETAFMYCQNLTNVQLPQSLVHIGNAAFLRCTALEKIVLPEGTATVGKMAFYMCENLRGIDIPVSVETVEREAFSGCTALESVYYAGSQKDWNKITFGKNNWDLINGQIDFEKYALVDTEIVASGECGDNTDWILTSDGVLTISGYGPMEGWGYYKNVPWNPYANQVFAVNIKSGVTTVGSLAFNGCVYLESVTLPDTVTRLYEASFARCKKLTSVCIPDGVTSVGTEAFSGCEALASVYIPESVWLIYPDSFENCSSLKDVYYAGTASQWEEIEYIAENEVLRGVRIHVNSTPDMLLQPQGQTDQSTGLSKRLSRVEVTYADGSVGGTEFCYSDAGLLVSTNMVTPYTEQETIYSYDSENRLLSVQIDTDYWREIGPKYTYVYDRNGRLTEASQSEGSTITEYYEYDSTGLRIRSFSEGEGVSHSSQYIQISSNQIDEVRSSTDYEGNVTQNRISRYYDDFGRIIREESESYTRSYGYDSKPFVTISENQDAPYRLYLPDKMGHPIWQIEYISIASIQNDTQGYLNRIITDSGDVYDFIYEEITIREDPEGGNTISGEEIPEREYTLEVYSVDRNLSVKPGRELQLLCVLSCDGEPVADWEGIGWGIVKKSSEPDVIEVSKYEPFDQGYRLYVKGLREGTASLDISELRSGEVITLEIKVGDQYPVPVGCGIENVPDTKLDRLGDKGTQVNFYNYNGLYISNYASTFYEKEDKYVVTFDAYNRSYMHGSVDIYDRSGTWIGSKRIDKNENVRGIVDTLYGGVVASTEIITGRSFSYQASTYTTKTKIEIEVPNGGYFVIGNNMSHSPGVFVYNGIDLYLRIMSAANDIVFSAVDTEAIQDLTIGKLLESESFMKAYQQGIADIMINTSGSALEKGYTQTVSGIVDGMVDFIGESIKESVSATIGIAEAVVADMLPPQFSVWLDVLFGISTVTDSLGQAIDICSSVNKTYIVIYTEKASGKLTVQGVTAKPDKEALPENATLRVCRLPSNEILSVDSLGIETEDYQLYDISFTSEGVEVEPDGRVTIRIPEPQARDWPEYAVLHQQKDGSWKLVPSKLENGKLVIQIDHFSLFAIVNGVQIRQGLRTEPYLLIAIIGGGILLLGSVTAVIVTVSAAKKRRRRKQTGRFLRG